jgi:hypothetical protein
MAIIGDDARRKASRLVVERLSDGFGERIRVMSQIEVLERRGALTARQARAGDKIYWCWSVGVLGISDAEPNGQGGDAEGYAAVQLDAAKLYREVRDRVGPRLWPITFACVIEDFSPFRWANERGHMHKAAAAQLLRLALDTAADALGIANE